MLRAMQVEYPGAIYQVMDRGDRREDISINDVDRQDLLKTLAEACQPLCRSSGSRRGCNLARPKGLSRCSIARASVSPHY
jgi:hypothetical protein